MDKRRAVRDIREAKSWARRIRRRPRLVCMRARRRMRRVRSKVGDGEVDSRRSSGEGAGEGEEG